MFGDHLGSISKLAVCFVFASVGAYTCDDITDTSNEMVHERTVNEKTVFYKITVAQKTPTMLCDVGDKVIKYAFTPK